MNDRELAQQRRAARLFTERSPWFTFAFYLLVGRLGMVLAFVLMSVVMEPLALVWWHTRNDNLADPIGVFLLLDAGVIAYLLVIRMTFLRKRGDEMWRKYKSGELAAEAKERLEDAQAGLRHKRV